MKLGLSLLAQGALTESQFQTLCRDRCRQLTSHTAAQQEFERRHVKAVCVGIDHYGEHLIGMCVSDAKFMSDVLKRSAGLRDEDLTLLTEEKATRQAFCNALRDATHSLKKGDLLIVSFAGLGWRKEAEKDSPKESGWLFCKEGNSQPPTSQDTNAPHRGLDMVGDVPERLAALGDGLSIDFLDRGDCDTLIISDTCYADPHEEHLSSYDWTETSERKDEPEKNAASRPNRVYIYSPDMALSYADINHGIITYLVARGLSGAADRMTPQIFSPDNATPPGPGVSDGFVSLRELVQFCRANSVYRGRDFVKIKGNIGSRDAIVSRSTLVAQ